MAMDTASVTRPRTGLAFLDAGLDQPGAVLAFAHRGGARHPDLSGLENTLTAFEHAVALGYRYLETDVHSTRDGVLLAFHDAMLDRVTSGSGNIAEVGYGELAETRISDRERIPTLASLFERFPDVCFNIDIKSETAINPLVDLIRLMNAYDRVCVASFSGKRMTTFRSRMDREVATAFGPAAVALARFSPRGLVADRMLRGRGHAFQVPHGRGRVVVVTEAFVAKAHAAGRPVHVWTVDDPAEMNHLLDLGVDGLITDRTDLLRDVLQQRGQWMGETT